MLRSGQEIDAARRAASSSRQRLGREPVLAVEPGRRDVDPRQVDRLARLQAVLDQRRSARGAWRSGSAPSRSSRPPARNRPGPRRWSATSSTSGARRAAAAPWPVRSSSPSMLFRCSPVVPANTPEPQPVELVIAAALPAASTTETWLVPRGVASSAHRPAGRPQVVEHAAPRRARPTGPSSSRRAPPRASGARQRRPAPRLRLAQDRGERAHRRRGRADRRAGGSRSCSASAYASSRPPDDGGALVRTRWPRNVTSTGRRRITR